ncbi:MAG: hypothetical protein GY855_08555, partial [candidate division Zixibacteria bacterium]|nr:hypothetical protein [candidate division Zixibacteria bacterium]
MGYRILFLTALVFAFASASVVASSPGDTIGTTYYDLQTMNVAGSRICSDTLGGYHFLWMYTPDSSGAPRQTYYNFIDEVGSKAWSAGTQVNVVDGAGFGSITTFYNGNAAIAYHRGDTVWFAKDGSRGAGVFSLVPIPNDYPGLDPGLWPKISRDSSGNFQVFMSVDEASIAIPFVYTYSTDGGSNWETVDIADTVVNITPTATASRVSTKAACVYGRPRDPSTPDYYDCDLYYA